MFFSLIGFYKVGNSGQIDSKQNRGCSKLYGCQTNDPQDEIVNENLVKEKNKRTQKLTSVCKNILLGRDHDTGATLKYSERHNRWYVPKVRGEKSIKDLEKDLESFSRTELNLNAKFICPVEFNDYANKQKEAKNFAKPEKLIFTMKDGEVFEFPVGTPIKEINDYLEKHSNAVKAISKREEEQKEKLRTKRLKCVEKYSRNQKNDTLGKWIGMNCGKLVNSKDKKSKKMAKCSLEHLSKSNNKTNARAGMALCRDKYK